MFWLSRRLKRPISIGDVMWEDKTVVDSTGEKHGR